jgi:Pentapeptide repeats (8 copies)
MRDRQHPKFLRRAILALVVAVLVTSILALAFLVPRLLYPSLSAADLRRVSDPAQRIQLEHDRLQLQNEARATLLQGLGGFAVLLGAGVAYRQVIVAQRQAMIARSQAEIASQSQITERFTRAIDQLGNEHGKLDVVIGGIYALERIARDSPDDRATIGEVLTAYIRGHATASSSESDSDHEQSQDLFVRAPDIQAALTVLVRGRFADDETGRWLDLRNVDLRRADLEHADLRGAKLKGVRLNEALLLEASLQGANLESADLEGARLVGVDLRGAYLVNANLTGASLLGADLGGATLCNAKLEGADLSDALMWTEVFGVYGDVDLKGATADARTRWPTNFDPAARGALIDRSQHPGTANPAQTG